ncbi:hypothetical protein CHS0354_015047 [Potamilus streckersoni]|uniref:Uncharacterized protein n=1 Tax=Potamilus streckersoni TaxID=2493646 RepID=A0AAE0WDS1_9BIVA|nr:hypothetical protein CHS0354_015047 [Potamilus streckersoni]
MLVTRKLGGVLLMQYSRTNPQQTLTVPAFEDCNSRATLAEIICSQSGRWGRGSELATEYKKKLASGDILPLPPPDWCDVSNALCQSFFCYCCRNCGEESDSEHAVPLLKQYQDSAQKKEDELQRLLNGKTEDVLRKLSSRSLVPGSLPQRPQDQRLSSSDQVTPLLSQVYESYPGTSQREKSPEENANPHASEDDEEEEEDSEEEDSEEVDREEEENNERDEMECYVDAVSKMGEGMHAEMHTGNGHPLMMTHNGDRIDNFNQRQTCGGIYGPQINSFQEVKNINNQASSGSFIYEYPYDRRMSAYYKYRQQRQSSMHHYNKNCNHFSDQHEQSQQKERESHPEEQGHQSNNLPIPGMQIQDNVNVSYANHLEFSQQQEHNSSENTNLIKLDATDLVKCRDSSFYRPWTRAEHKLSKVTHFHTPSPSPTAVTGSQPRAGHSSDVNKAASSGTYTQNSYSGSLGNRHKSGNTNTDAFLTSEIEQNAQNIPGETKPKLPKALTHKLIPFANHCISRAPDRTQEDSTRPDLVSMEKFAQQNCSSFQNPFDDGERPSFATNGNYTDLRPSTNSHLPVLPKPNRNYIAQDDDHDDVGSTPSNIPVMFVPTNHSAPVDTHLNRFTSKSKDCSRILFSSTKTAAQESPKYDMPPVNPTTRFIPVTSCQPMNDESSRGNKTVLEDSPKSISNGEAKTKGLILMRRFRFDVTNANTNSECSPIYYGTNLLSDYCNNSHGYASLDFGDDLGLHKINERTCSKDIMDISDYGDTKSAGIILNKGLKDEDNDFSNLGDLDIDFNLISFDDDPPFTDQCSSNLLKASADFSVRDSLRSSDDSEEGQSITVDLNESMSSFKNQSFGMESDTSTIVGEDNHLLERSEKQQVHIIDFSDLTQSLQ